MMREYSARTQHELNSAGHRSQHVIIIFFLLMSRVMLAPNDILTPFDLRGQIFRVNVELSAYHRGQKFVDIFSKKCPRVTSRLEKISYVSNNHVRTV